MEKFMSMSVDECLPYLEGHVKELKDIYDQLKNQMEMQPVFEHPFNMIITGQTSTGKTYYLVQILLADKIQPPPDVINLFTGVKDSTGELIKALDTLYQEKGIPYYHHGDNIDKVSSVIKDSEVRKLIIMDDLMTQVSKIMTSNAHYNVIFYNPKLVSFRTFASQRGQLSQLMTLYKEMKGNRDNQPLVIDNKHNQVWTGLNPNFTEEL